ncbi:YjcZ family sporulation protein [Neobacillus vireti]
MGQHGGNNNGFALIVVLFILLIIVGFCIHWRRLLNTNTQQKLALAAIL